MPKTTFRTFLIFLIIICAVSIVFLKKHPPFSSLAQTKLTFGPLARSISENAYSLPVVVATGTNKVTGIQIVLKYDPQIIQNVKISAGSFFTNPVTLIKKIDKIDGNISYVLAFAPQDSGKQGSGIAAILTFESKAKAATKTEIQFLPKSLATAEGIAQSVLGSATSTQITVGK